VAAVAGGKKELQQAAREVREAKSSQRAAAVAEMLDAPAAGGDALPTAPEEVAALVKRLRQTIADLSAENTKLKAEIARQQGSAA
jgi:cell division protein FtsB